MHLLSLITALILGTSPAIAANDAFQKDIDSAIQEILLTKVGQGICQKILGADPAALEFHLGVSHEAAGTLAQSCNGDVNAQWIAETSRADVRKLTLKSFQPRKYVLLSAETSFPIESWTDPFSNTTVFLTDRVGISHERLVQLLAHELAVYFDSKANPAHADAQNVPELRDLKLNSEGQFNPLVAVSDPLIAHTLTFVRALQVEYAIVDELIAMRKILPPADHDDPYLQFLVSKNCKEDCLERLIGEMRGKYLPIALPLLAYSPQFRVMVGPELAKARPLWRQTQWHRVQDSLNTLPADFLLPVASHTLSPLEDMQRTFVASNPPPEFQTVSKFDNDLWRLERPAIFKSTLDNGEPFLEFMKKPLLSGYNILLSSGPRVRVTTGNVE